MSRVFYKYCLGAIFTIIKCCSLQAQDSLFVPSADSLFVTVGKLSLSRGALSRLPFYIYHSPNDGDDSIYNNYKQLANKQPTSKNYDTYYNLAGAFWDYGKLDTAEKMFLTIVNSAAPYYCKTSYHSSGTTYGYGSFTSNYKNGAAIYLAKIYLEKKLYPKVLTYTKLAINKYKVEYTCGTGYRWQKEEYDFLLASSYEGLKNYNSALNILMPDCLGTYSEMSARILKKIYSSDVIKNELLNAQKSITCKFDTSASMSYTTTYGSADNENHSDTSYYYSGNAAIKLFGYKVTIPTPNLTNGEHVTKQKFTDVYKTSIFYTLLAEYAGLTEKKLDDDSSISAKLN